MNTPFLRLLALTVALLLGTAATVAHAQDLATIRARMEKRLPQVDALKSQGALGENNRGLLDVLAPAENADTIASAENADRSSVYAALAKQTGSSAETVGKTRARQIAANSAAGVWLQRDSGEWYKK
jgi:uncharacterized protein YdbL (DUF1318 family)